MATIGVIAIKMVADSEKWSTGLNKAGASLGSLANVARDKTSAGLDLVKKGFADLRAGGATADIIRFKMGLDQIGSGAVGMAKGLAAVPIGLLGRGAKLAGGFASALGQAVPYVIALGTAAVVGFGGLVHGGMESITTMSASARRVGLTTQQFAELSYQAKMTGTSVEMLEPALLKLNEHLVDASLNGGPAADTLKRLGLDVDQVAAKNPAEKLQTVRDAIRGIKDPAEQAAAAVALFGKSGAASLNFLNLSPEKAAALNAELKKLGGSVNSVDAAKVVEANHAIEKIWVLLEGVGQQIAIQLAPAIEMVSTKFIEWSTSGSSVGEKVSVALEWIGSGVGLVADGAQLLKVGFLGLQNVITTAAAYAVDQFVGVGQALEAVANLIPGVKVSFGTFLESLADGLHKTAETQVKDFKAELAKAPPSEGIKSFFTGLTSAAKESAKAVDAVGNSSSTAGAKAAQLAVKIGETVSELKKEIATFGMSAAAVKLYELQQQGATAAQLAEVKALAERRDAMEKGKKDWDDLKEKAKKTFDETRTAAEKLEIEKTDLSKQFSAGLIDKDTFARAIEKAENDAMGDKKNNAGALEFGSKEARSAILEAQGRSSAKDPIKEVADTSKKQLTAAEQSQRILAEIAATVGASIPTFAFPAG